MKQRLLKRIEHNLKKENSLIGKTLVSKTKKMGSNPFSLVFQKI